MATIQGFRMHSPVAGTLAFAVSASLLAGGIGGYLVRNFTVPASARVSASPVQHAAPKAAAELPAWVEKYTAVPQTPRFRVDDMIESLSYAGTTGRISPDQLPDWLQKYLAVPQPTPIRIDDCIRQSFKGC